jgi:hypothetical protein
LEEFPEQVPYLEWRHSEYRVDRPCQSCHMQVVGEDTPISSVLGEPRNGFSRHSFRGGNFLMPRIFNRFRGDLGVTALPQELESSARQTRQHLATDSARISIFSAQISDGYLTVSLTIQNLAGHKLPTAYPSRRAWIHLVVRDGDEGLVFESGRFRQDGSIEGNDNDSDPSLYEPHLKRIDSPDDVQIYEAIMVDHSGAVTTGLLSGLRYVKDNRLLPRGFDKGTAEADIAVHGQASSDMNFKAEGDSIEYVIALRQTQGPYTVEAELWYQPISFRWAENLSTYDSAEPNRFFSYYEPMAGSSAVILARAELVAGPR